MIDSKSSDKYLRFFKCFHVSTVLKRLPISFSFESKVLIKRLQNKSVKQHVRKMQLKPFEDYYPGFREEQDVNSLIFGYASVVSTLK